MPITDIVVLTAIVLVFATFGATLFGVTWYCGHTKKPQRPGLVHPANAHLVTDDD